MTHLPLLKLPLNATLSVLRTMKTIDLVILSTLSKTMKDLVRSLNITSEQPRVSIKDTVVIVIPLNGGTQHLNLEFTYQHRQNQTVDVNQSRSVRVRVSNAYFKAEQHQFNSQPQYWMDHLKYLFPFPRIDTLSFHWGNRHFDLLSVRRTFGDFETLYLRPDVFAQSQGRIFRIFQTAKQLSLLKTRDPKVLIQNFDSLSIGQDSRRASELPTDDVMLMNAKSVMLIGLTFTEKDLNRILKLWIKGRFPRWERVYSLVNKELCESKLLKGIKYQCSRPDQRFKLSFEEGITKVASGVDIRRKDGVRATIEVYEHLFSMFIWHSHCISPSK